MNCRVILACLLVLAAMDARSKEWEIASVRDTSCLLVMEANPRWKALVVRVRPSTPERCRIAEASLVQLLDSAFAQIEPRKEQLTYSSIFLGRIVAYPWMSEALALAAAKDKGWDKREGRSRDGNENRIVSCLLAGDEMMLHLVKVVKKWGYRLVGISVEKVLVGTDRDIPDYTGPKLEGRVPFDAQVWLKLERNSGPRDL